MIKHLKPYLSPFRKWVYRISGKKPWSYGYVDSRWAFIEQTINNPLLLTHFEQGTIPAGFGVGMDERVVEYPWLLSKLSDKAHIHLLDAGSTFNFAPLVAHPLVSIKALTIYTYYPEENQFLSKRISYQYGDLRQLPYRDVLFDEIVCQSTIEHIDMDNTMYGYTINAQGNEQTKSYAYLQVVDELLRILKPNGTLLLTFPYGKFEYHGFFQQFDEEMLSKMVAKLQLEGHVSKTFIRYTTGGWTFDTQENCNNSESYNPHTGKGKGADGAAHCRCVCCISFTKN